MSTDKKLVGKPVKRREDQRFVTGKGRYTADITLPNQAFAVFVRSDQPHAKLRQIATSAAKNSPGVLDVLTGADVAADGLGGLPCGWMIHSKDGSEMKQPMHPVLANGKVNHVGEPLAMVIAETQAAAARAADLVEVDYEELPAVVDLKSAASAPAIYADIPGNTCYQWELGDEEATNAAFKTAAHVSRLEYVNNRLIPNAMEPRAAIGDYNPGTEELTLYTTSQNPHLARLVLSAFVQLAPEHRLRILAPDVGGGFGSKIFIYSEETACAWASKRLARPVKWVSDRSEAFMSDAHGRDHLTSAELAMDEKGRFLGLRVKTLANMGAYLSTFASAVPTYLYGTLMAGQYKTPAIHVQVDALFTNSVPVDAYRGAGRPEATYLLERLVDAAAFDLKMDPAEIRRQNLIQPADFPYQTPVALEYDTGDYEASLNRALEMADYAGFAKRREEAGSRGRLRGLGLSCYIEACGLAPSQVAGALGAGVGLYESGKIRVNPTGNVTVLTGSHSHGQGHETTFAQLVADRFGLDLEDVEVVHGDTARMEFGLGTYGSRSLAVGGSALSRAADKIISKGKKIAAHMMQTDEENVEFADGSFRVPASNQSRSFQEVAFAAYVPHDYPLEDLEPGLTESAFYDPANFTYPAGCHICEVEIDPETGRTEIVSFTAVDDFGRIINPMIVAGQVHGGLAQGIGQALLEQCVYDESGQLLTGSWMDYCMPRADDLPDFDVDLTETPCTHNPLGVKGCGEAGAIGSPPAVINAIAHALGIREMQMPATPETVWKAARKEN